MKIHQMKRVVVTVTTPQGEAEDALAVLRAMLALNLVPSLNGAYGGQRVSMVVTAEDKTLGRQILGCVAGQPYDRAKITLTTIVDGHSCTVFAGDGRGSGRRTGDEQQWFYKIGLLPDVELEVHV